MATYRKRPGQQILTPPYLANQTSFFGFVFHVTPQQVNAQLIDPILNKPLGDSCTRYNLWLPFAIGVFNHIADFSCRNPPDDNIGIHSEQEFAIWLLVNDTISGDIYFFHPFMFVDNFYALSIGREVYGFPKQNAEFNLIPDLPLARMMQARATAIPTYGSNNRSSLIAIATASPPSAAQQPQDVDNHSDPDSLMSSLKTAVELPHEELRLGNRIDCLREFKRPQLQDSELSSLLVEDVIKLVENFIHLKVPFVFLKQFPDLDGPGAAVYQAITAADLTVAKFHRGSLMSPSWKLQLADYDSHPMLRTLGRKGENQISAWLSFWVLMDFTVPAPRVIQLIH